MEGQGSDHQMTVREEQLDGLLTPHHGMEGAVQNQVPQRSGVPNTNLLVGAILLIERGGQHKIRVQRQPAEAKTGHTEEESGRTSSHMTGPQGNRTPPPERAEDYLKPAQ